MNSIHIISLASLLWCTLPALAEPGVEVIGVELVKKIYGPENGTRVAPFNRYQIGLEIALGFSLKEGSIILLDEEDSVLEKFADDKGTDLITKEFGRKGFGSFPQKTEDGKYGVMSVATSKLPAEGATKVTASGKIVVTTASAKKTERTKVMELKKDAVVALGKITFKVTDADTNADGMSVTLETTDAVSDIAEIRFVGEGNAALKSDRNGTSSFGFAGKKTTSLSYSIKGKAAKVMVEADMWQDARKVDVPFDITVSLPVATSK